MQQLLAGSGATPEPSLRDRTELCGCTSIFFNWTAVAALASALGAIAAAIGRSLADTCFGSDREGYARH